MENRMRKLWFRIAALPTVTCTPLLFLTGPVHAASAAADTTVSVSAGTLTISAGPVKTNVITISQQGADFSVNDLGDTLTAVSPCAVVTGDPHTAKCPAAGVSSIQANVLDQNDQVDVTGTSIPTTLDGGPGEDTLSGGSGPDRIRGADKDTLDGRLGTDDMFGDGGPDTVLGGTGDDTIRGGPGNDIVDGGVGNDNVVGGPDDDELFGGPGDDTLSGAAGKDAFDGGPGTDTCDNDAGEVATSCEI
jgi:Ca2+-binding RTX toxin-like protein